MFNSYWIYVADEFAIPHSIDNKTGFISKYNFSTLVINE